MRRCCGVFNKATAGQYTDHPKVNADGFGVYSLYQREDPHEFMQVSTSGGGAIPGAKEVIDLNRSPALQGGPYILGKQFNGQAVLWGHSLGAFPSIPLLAQPSGGGLVVGRALSNSLVIPMGSILWRNSRMHSIAGLCGNPPGWSDFHITRVSPDNNLLAGSAKLGGVAHSILMAPANIIPAEGMTGVVGDIIPSNNGFVGDKHFVSPKKNEGIPDDYVVFKAGGVTEELFQNLFEWEGGEAVPNELLKRRVKRDVVGKTVIKIKAKNGGQNIVRLNVWIVWAVANFTEISLESLSVDTVHSTSGAVGPGLRIRGGYSMSWTVSPEALFSDPDRPALDGQNKTRPPGSGLHHFITGGDFANGANKKWDTSRQVRRKIINPGAYSTGELATPETFWTADLSNYPDNPLIGNDDSSQGDEIVDPYSPPKAVLIGNDLPSLVMRDGVGANGDMLEIRLQFKEFSRLEINGKWFVISDYYPWRIHTKFLRMSGKWSDDGSSLAEDNSGY